MRLSRLLFVQTVLALACASSHAARIYSQHDVVVNGNTVYDNYVWVYSKDTDVKKACQAQIPTFGFDPGVYCTDASNIFAGYLQDPQNPDHFYSFYWGWCPTGTDMDPQSGCKPFQLVDKVLAPCATCEATALGDAVNLLIGNPLQPLRGAKAEVIPTGMSIGGLGLSFHYDSVKQLIAAAEGRDLQSWNDLPSLGPLWSTNLHRVLIVNPHDVQAYRGAGAIVSFTIDAANFVPGADVRDRLVADGTGFKYMDASGAVETYDAAGHLTTLKPIGGGQLTFVHSTVSTPLAIAPAPGYLVTVNDPFGRSLSFAYTLPAGADVRTGGKLSTVTDSEGRVLASAYDSQANLVTLTWQDGTTNQFLYENPAFPMALTGVFNGTGTRRSTFEYDTHGVATGTARAGDTLRYSVAYATPPAVVMTKVYDAAQNIMFRTETWAAPTGTVLTLPNGTTTSLSASSVLGSNVVTSTTQVAGSGSPASTSTTVYNDHGKQIQRDDYRGVRWCAAYDAARNLPVVSVEGLSTAAACSAVTVPAAALPAGSRKTTTSWHPSWSLLVQVFEPLLRTTRVYNGQPDPFDGGAIASCVVPADASLVVECKRVEQATLDADGHLGTAATLDTAVQARIWRTTVNSNGQVLSTKGPRTDLDDTTSFAYFTDTAFTGVNPAAVGHTVGDLHTVTDGVGHVTTFGTYNKNGQPLQSADANAISTVYTYDAKDRVTSASVGGQATGYTYDLNGQLQKIALPGGVNTLTFEHDAALRQTAVIDNRGNRIDYGLDNFGTWTTSGVKDPTGALARTLARAMDDLGRIQRVTGQE